MRRHAMGRLASAIGPVLGLALALVASGRPASAQTPAEFYKGRTIDVYIGFSAGGVYDITARLMARTMGKFIPGNPSLVARNMTGAGSLRLANWLYTQGPKDGTAIATFGRGAAFETLVGGQGVMFEAAKFNWLGSTNDEVSTCVSWSASGVTSFDQLYTKELIVGSSGGSADDEQFPRVLNGVLGTKLRVVAGFPGGNEIKMAMERGEVGGRCGWSWSSVKATQAQWLKDKKIAILTQLSLRRHADLPDVPAVYELAKTDQDRQIFKVIFARSVLAWPYVAPPGVPAERVAVLRKAFDETVKDPEFLAEAQRLSLEVAPVSGERIQSLIEELYRSTGPELTQKIGSMLK